ncbi:MAG: FliH/SctL family protein [Methylomonas sp.]|nr:FliH/SctL family protein [Methylomonas sp.]
MQDNPLITRGGCTVETEVSTVDATLEKRLSEVIALMLGDERQQDGSR